MYRVAWPSGLRRWFKAPVSSEAWVRIPPLPESFLKIGEKRPSYTWPNNWFVPTWLSGLGVWFLLWVQEVPGSNPGWARIYFSKETSNRNRIYHSFYCFVLYSNNQFWSNFLIQFKYSIYSNLWYRNISLSIWFIM